MRNIFASKDRYLLFQLTVLSLSNKLSFNCFNGEEMMWTVLETWCYVKPIICLTHDLSARSDWTSFQKETFYHRFE